MDLTTLFGWIIALIVITGLSIYLRNRNLSKKKRDHAVLHNFASEHQAIITESDHWNHSHIGIDPVAPGKLFYIRKTSEGEIRHCIFLNEVNDCRWMKSESRSSFKHETINTIENIELVLSFQDHRPDLSLEFYNSGYDRLTISEEMNLSRKWSDIIKKEIAIQGKKKISKKEEKEVKNPARNSKPVTRSNKKVNSKNKNTSKPV